jgi:hypothetical protein
VKAAVNRKKPLTRCSALPSPTRGARGEMRAAPLLLPSPRSYGEKVPRRGG